MERKKSKGKTNQHLLVHYDTQPLTWNWVEEKKLKKKEMGNCIYNYTSFYIHPCFLLSV